MNQVQKISMDSQLEKTKEDFRTFKIDKLHLKGKNEYKLQMLSTPTFRNKIYEIKECLFKCEILENIGKWNVSFLGEQIKPPIPIPDSGVIIRFDQMIQLSIRTALNNLTIKFSFYVLNEDGLTVKEEFAYAYARLCSSDIGELDLPMVSPRGNLIAMWNMRFLKIKSFFGKLNQPPQFGNGFTMPNHPFIGHRGHGTTFSSEGVRISDYLENTISSMRAAYDKGIRVVEFDVQLSKDKVPVVYHDFKTNFRLLNADSESKIQIPVQELKYDDLKKNQFQLNHDSKNKYDESFYNDDKTKLFPKLEHLFKKLPEDLCFDIEIKYSMALVGGVMEDNLMTSTDKNEYVDSILRVCFKFIGKRNIFFSSFDPDVCSILKAKQSYFPVMLISGNTRPLSFNHRYAQTLEAGIAFAAVEKLYGVVFYSTPLLDEKKILIMKAHKLGLKMFTWGRRNNEEDMVQIQQDLSVDAIALDNIDMVKKEWVEVTV